VIRVKPKTVVRGVESADHDRENLTITNAPLRV
jgi:hypothetical protein